MAPPSPTPAAESGARCPDRESPTARAPRFLPWLLFALLLAVYHANGVAIPGGDTVPHRYLPFSLLCEHDLDLDEIPLDRRLDGSRTRPYFLVEGTGGHRYSTFGPLPGILATPFFAVARAMSPVFPYIRVLAWAKGAAATFTALAAVLLYLGLLPGHGYRRALGLALVFGLCTSSWSVTSQSLWQHSAAAPLLAGAVLLLLEARRGRDRRLPWAGLLLGLATLCRPTDLLLALAVTGWVALHRRHRLGAFLALAAIPAALHLAWATWALGSPFATGQGLVAAGIAAHKTGSATPWAPSLSAAAEGIAGQLLSPSRGLFVYSPVLLVGLVGFARSARSGGETLLRWFGVGIAAVVVLHGLRFDWWGGWTYGYRFPLDTLPFWIPALAAALPRHRPLSPAKKVLGTVLVTFSLAVQVLGAFSYDLTSWNAHPDVDRHPERLWSVREGQLAWYLAHARLRTRLEGWDTAPFTLTLCPVRIRIPIAPDSASPVEDPDFVAPPEPPADPR